jgi:hypothetical protein
VRRGANPCADVGWGWGREARRVPAGGARRRGGPGRSRTCRRGRPGRRRDPLAAKEEIAGNGVGRDGERGFWNWDLWHSCEFGAVPLALVSLPYGPLYKDMGHPAQSLYKGALSFFLGKNSVTYVPP